MGQVPVQSGLASLTRLPGRVKALADNDHYYVPFSANLAGICRKAMIYRPKGDPMQLSGRSYIFLAATLLLLAGSMRFYADVHASAPAMLTTLGREIRNCEAHSVRTANVRIGCQADRFGQSGSGVRMWRGASQTIRIGG